MFAQQKRYQKGVPNEVETRLAWLVHLQQTFHRVCINFGNQNRAQINETQSWKAMSKNHGFKHREDVDNFLGVVAAGAGKDPGREVGER